MYLLDLKDAAIAHSIVLSAIPLYGRLAGSVGRHGEGDVASSSYEIRRRIHEWIQ